MTSLHATPQDFDAVWIKAFRRTTRRKRLLRALMQAGLAIAFLCVSIGFWWTLSWVTR